MEAGGAEARDALRFGPFLVKVQDRLLLKGEEPVDVNGRYFDALVLLAREQGRLVTKDRFLDEVWRGVPVTDEALTQCIRTLRRQLGDDAANPRFIETVPKHGYRFIAPVDSGDVASSGLALDPQPPAQPLTPSQPVALSGPLRLGLAGTAGGAAAGLLGGLIYGSLVATRGGAMGATSVLFVMAALTALVGLLGGAGVAFGSALTARPRITAWSILGGAAGGFLVGAVVKLIGADALALLFGRSPDGITGGPEGALLGAAIGLAAWLALRSAEPPSAGRGAAIGGTIGGAAGLIIPLLGGRLMGGSLEELSRFPESRLSLERISALFGANYFGPVTQAATGLFEGLLFGAVVVGAMAWARRRG